MFFKSNHLIFSLILFYLLIQINGKKQFCLSSETKPILNSGYYTNYEDIRGSDIEIPKNCKPIYLWSLIQTLEENKYTYPFAEYGLPAIKDDIIKIHDENRGELCDEEVAKLKAWTHLKMNISDDLLSFIRTNTKNWVERLKLAFNKVGDRKQLLKKPTAGERPFEIQSANTKEAKASASEMARILYGSKDLKGDNQYYVENNVLLQMNKHCTIWWRFFHNPFIYYSMIRKFNRSKKWRTTMKNIDGRLGFNNRMARDPDELLLLYVSCVTNNFQNRSLPFCSTLLPEHLKMVEYFLDSTTYDGLDHTNPNSIDFGSSIIKMLLSNLTNAAQNENPSTKASFFSSTTRVFASTVVKLGLFRDEYFPDLDNDDAIISNRKWKTSFILPSSANLIAALYKCPQNDSKPQVAFFFNEKPISLPGCDGNLCSLDFLNKTYADALVPVQGERILCNQTDWI